jgi:hypothetical protein
MFTDSYIDEQELGVSFMIIKNKVIDFEFDNQLINEIFKIKDLNHDDQLDKTIK